MRYLKRPIRCFATMLSCILPFVAPARYTVPTVGLAPIEVLDPVGGEPMPGFVFYPAAAPVEPATLGPYHVAAGFGVEERPGAKPLVVISHGNAGSNLGHHDLATHLASNGFVVATLQHPKDNFRDQSGVGHPEVLFGRPVQVSALISALLADARWKASIDPDRIGIAGFSMGGYTSLLLVGGVPRFGRYEGYCERHPEDRATCDMIQQLADASESRSWAHLAAAIEKDFKRWGDPADARIKAAFAMAPTSVVFDEAGAASIDRPVFLYYGEQDRVLPPSENAVYLAPLIEAPLEVRTVPDAGHWVFLAPCSPELAREVEDVCSDPPGVDRVAVHERVNADALSFFRKTFDVAIP